MRLIGLTGGTGSGKSAAGKRFAEHNIPVIDADAVGHSVYEPGGPAYEPLIEAFGPDILSGDRIDRAKLGAVVFNDEAARGRLNAIVHPAIQQAIGARCAELAAEGHETVIIDAALLGESGQRDPWLAALILVLAPEEVRIARLVEHRGIAADEARRRIRAQRPPEEKIDIADFVLDNGGTLDNLYRQVDTVAGAMLTHGA